MLALMVNSFFRVSIIKKYGQGNHTLTLCQILYVVTRDERGFALIPGQKRDQASMPPQRMQGLVPGRGRTFSKMTSSAGGSPRLVLCGSTSATVGVPMSLSRSCSRSGVLSVAVLVTWATFLSVGWCGLRSHAMSSCATYKFSQIFF